MPTPTPELGLEKAIDSDDTADYLDSSLANSLVTIDTLFNNVSGHTHGGVHQGGPITSIPVSAIPDGSITSAKITDGTIQTVDLADGAVTNAKLAAGSVLTANIVDGQVTSATIADGTITGADIAANTITSANITDGTISGGDIAAGTISGGNIAANTITSANIADGTIGGVDIGAGTITSGNIADGGINTVDLANGLITAAKLSSGDSFAMAGLHVTGTATLDAAVQMPGGAVIANGTGAQVSIGTTPYSAYRLTLANLGSPAGQGIAQSWVTYACVDHARIANLSVDAITDPIGKLRGINAYYYDHLSTDADGNVLSPQASTPTYGMSPSEVAGVIPELASAANNTVDYGRLVTVLWAACQQLDARLSALEAA